MSHSLDSRELLFLFLPILIVSKCNILGLGALSMPECHSSQTCHVWMLVASQFTALGHAYTTIFLCFIHAVLTNASPDR